MGREYLAEFVCRKGQELFGDAFRCEREDAIIWNYVELSRDIFKKNIEREDMDFCHISIDDIWVAGNTKIGAEMQLVETAEGMELVCDMLGFLQAEDIEKLKQYPDCRFGVRNNRLGVCEICKTFAGKWYRIHSFRTKNPECAEILLDAIARYKYSNTYKKGIESETVEISELMPAAWKLINKLFNAGSTEALRTEYYPSFDSKDELYYDNFIIWLNETFCVEIHKYPNYQELVCEKPACFWKNREVTQRAIGKKNLYLDELIKIEEAFAKSMAESDRNSIVLMGASEKIPYLHVEEVRITDIPTAEIFFQKLKENKCELEKFETEQEKAASQELTVQRLKDYY